MQSTARRNFTVQLTFTLIASCFPCKFTVSLQKCRIPAKLKCIASDTINFAVSKEFRCSSLFQATMPDSVF